MVVSGWLILELLFSFRSLLSHSAVVARELGLPTIVGVSGGLMKRLKTGMRVHLDAGKGRVTIQDQEGTQEQGGLGQHEE